MTYNPHGQSFQTGDINLAAACMACSIPLTPIDPVSQIEHPNGHRYGRFSLEAFSLDGKESTETLMEFWSGNRNLPLSHGMVAISEFIKAKPKEIVRTADLLDFAVDFLQTQGFILTGIRSLDDIAGYVNTVQNTASYILAYVANRDLCFQLYRAMSRKVYYEDGDADNPRRALVDTRLPKWKASEILSRLQG